MPALYFVPRALFGRQGPKASIIRGSFLTVISKSPKETLDDGRSNFTLSNGLRNIDNWTTSDWT